MNSQVAHPCVTPSTCWMPFLCYLWFWSCFVPPEYTFMGDKDFASFAFPHPHLWYLIYVLETWTQLQIHHDVLSNYLGKNKEGNDNLNLKLIKCHKWMRFSICGNLFGRKWFWLRVSDKIREFLAPSQGLQGLLLPPKEGINLECN